ncbi:rod-determining factor RdfA [Halobacteriaceae archaeon GCM10025711]
MTAADGSDEVTPASRSKVGRVIAEYDLTGLGDELVAYWTGENEERYSLRKLADVFNQRVLAAALESVGENPLDGEVENTYRLLTDDDVSQGMRIQTRNRLERVGLDVDDLTSDFVSHQAIHTYLTKYQEVAYEAEETDQVAKDRERISRLENRLSAVIEDALDRSRRADRIALEAFDVFVDSRVLCEECGTTYTVDELFENGGCDCVLADR